MTCRTCGLSDVPFRPGRSICRPCERAAARAYGRADRERRNARLRRWRAANPELAKAHDRRTRLRRKYQLAESDLDAMFVAQDGKCALCAGAKALVVDHDHVTGKVRALLCHRCNTSLGWLEAHPGLLDRAAAYLDQPCHADVLLELANR